MESMSPMHREKYGRYISWAVYLAAIVVGLKFLIDAITNINYPSFGDTSPMDAGYDAYTIAYVALRVGIAAACFLLAIAVRPRVRYSPWQRMGN